VELKNEIQPNMLWARQSLSNSKQK